MNDPLAEAAERVAIERAAFIDANLYALLKEHGYDGATKDIGATKAWLDKNNLKVVTELHPGDEMMIFLARTIGIKHLKFEIK